MWPYMEPYKATQDSTKLQKLYKSEESYVSVSLFACLSACEFQTYLYSDAYKKQGIPA